MSPRRRPGTPTTIPWAGTSCVTTAPAPIIASLPIVTPHRITAPLPDRSAAFHARRRHRPVRLRLQPTARGRARIPVVDEHNPVSYKYFRLKDHSLAEKTVRGDFASRADGRVLLDFHERADSRLVADRAAVEVDEVRLADRHVLAELHVRRDHLVRPRKRKPHLTAKTRKRKIWNHRWTQMSTDTDSSVLFLCPCLSVFICGSNFAVV